MAKAETVVAPPQSRKVQRSPNFPALPLGEALKRVEVVYRKDGRNAVPASVVLEHLGYGKKVSGSAGRVLSALRQYGLLDVTADDKYRLSDTGYLILSLPEDSPKRWEAIGKAATKPAVFREILVKYTERLPSDSALREYLIADRAFNPASVELFIRALKGTIEFAKLYETSYDAASGNGAGGEGSDLPVETQPDGRERISPSQALPLKAGTARDVFTLDEGEALLQWPSNLSAESLLDLEDWLALVMKKLKRRYAQS